MLIVILRLLVVKFLFDLVFDLVKEAHHEFPVEVESQRSSRTIWYIQKVL